MSPTSSLPVTRRPSLAARRTASSKTAWNGRDLVVREVDRDLGQAVILDVPADGFDLLEPARHLDRVAAGVLDDVAVLVPLGPAALPKAQGDLVGQLAVPRIEIDVVGDEELAGADDGRPRPRIENGLAEIGGPPRVLELLGQALVFPGPDRGQVAALGLAGRRLIEIDRDGELRRDALAELGGQPDALLHGDPGDRDEGTDVGGPDAAVGPLVTAHVDDLGGLGDGPERGLPDGIGGPDHGHHRPVRRGPGVDVEQLDAGDGLDLAADGPDLLRIPTLAEIGDAFDELHDPTPLRTVYLSEPLRS